MNKNLTFTRKTNILEQALLDELMIYDLESNKTLCLNKTASLVWKAIDGKKTINDISKTLTIENKTDISDDFVWLTLLELNKANLLDKNDLNDVEINKVSRRELVKRIGLGSIMALPVISMIVAPTAAAASSICLQVCSPCLFDPGNPQSDCCPDLRCYENLIMGTIPACYYI